MFNFRKLWQKKEPQKQEQKKWKLVSSIGVASSLADWSEWDAEKAIQEGFKSSVPVFSCVKKRYDAISSLPLVVEVKQGDDWVAAENHPLQVLLDNPNPMMDTSSLIRMMITHLDLAGNAVWHKVRGGRDNRPIELWPIAPAGMRINKLTDGMVGNYQFPNIATSILATDICHFKYTNPDSLYFGQSPLQAAGKAVDVDTSAQSWQKVSMQNRGVPDYMVSFDAELTPDQVQEASQLIKDKTGASNAREPLITSKASVQQLSLTPVEMDFMETRRFSREEVCSVYGVPSALIAEMGAVNLANSETARRLFWLDTVIPLMDEIIDALNHCLAKEYGNSQQIRITYDTSNVAALQENYGDKITNAQRLWAMGVPLNVINKRLELGFDEDDLPNGDTAYIPSGVIPASYDFSNPPIVEETEKVTDEVAEQLKMLIKQAKAKQEAK